MKQKKVRSGLEARIIKDLDSRKVAYGYEITKFKYIKQVCECGRVVSAGTYTVDFTITRSSGIPLYVEAKGRLTSADRTKYLQVLQSNQGIDLRFIFQRDQPIRKGSKKTYSMWAVKNKIPYSIGESIPENWL